MAHFTAEEKRELWARISRGGVAPSCPRCAATCSVIRAEPRRDVSYVRDRVVVRCASCGCAAALESTGRRAPGAALLLAGAALALAAASVAPLVASGQRNAAGTTPCREGESCPVAAHPGPLVLELAAGARSVALGGAFWTGGDEGGAIFHHPSLMSGDGFGMSYQRFRDPSATDDGGGFLTASGSGEWLGGVAGIGVTFVEYSASSDAPWSWPRSATELGAVGESTGLAYVAAGGFARELGGFRVGGAVKAVGMRHGARGDVVGAVDLGASTDVGPATVALTVQNLGPDLEMGRDGPTVPLARRVTLGAGAGRVPFGPFDVGGTVQVVGTGSGGFGAGGGVEVAWWPVLRRVFIARAGLVRTPDEWDGGCCDFTFGGGFAGDRIRLDYAYQRHGPQEEGYPPLTVSHTFGVAFR